MVEETAGTVTETTENETQEKIQEQPAVKVPEFKKPLNRMTAIELREVAMEIPDVEGVHAMKKEELLPIIKKYYGIQEEVAEKGKKKKAQKVAASVHELKAGMRALKEKKNEVRAAKDRKQTDILRRRINRMKKQTRKTAKG